MDEGGCDLVALQHQCYGNLSDEERFLCELSKARGRTPTVRRYEFAQTTRGGQHLRRELVPEIVEKMGQLALKVAGKYSMRNGPANDGKVPGPGSCRFRSPVAFVKVMEAQANPIAISVLVPAWCLCLEGLPVLISGIEVPKL